MGRDEGFALDMWWALVELPTKLIYTFTLRGAACCKRRASPAQAANV